MQAAAARRGSYTIDRLIRGPWDPITDEDLKREYSSEQYSGAAYPWSETSDTARPCEPSQNEAESREDEATSGAARPP